VTDNWENIAKSVDASTEGCFACSCARVVTAGNFREAIAHQSRPQVIRGCRLYRSVSARNMLSTGRS